MTDTLVERLEGKRPFRGTELRECFARIKAQASRIAELREAMLMADATLESVMAMDGWRVDYIKEARAILRKALEDKTLSNGGGI